MLFFIIFIVIFLTIIFSSHAWLYFSVVKFLTMPTESEMILLYIFILLSLSFIVAILCLRIHENFITRSFYLCSSLWSGLMTLLTLSLIMIWFIFAMSNFFALHLNMAVMSISFYLLALIFGIRGAYKAWYPVVKKIDVQIRNLPPEWQNKKIVQLSDLHLGAICRPKFLNKIVKQIDKLDPDLILITGDLFDGTDGNMNIFINDLKKLKAKQGVYFALGNHEEYLGIEESLQVIKQTDIKVLDNEAVQLSGLQLVGVSYHNHIGINNLDKNKPTILLNHLPVDIETDDIDSVTKHFKAYWKPDVVFDKAIELGVDLQLSGHTHAGQLAPFTWLTQWIYKGYAYGLHKQGDFSLYVSSGVGTWGPPMRVGSKSEIVLINLKK